MAPANVAYTSYMQSLAHRGGPLEIMASLLPCAWSYVEIATGLRESTDITHPVYGDWVGYFSMPTTVEMVDEMRRDFDAPRRRGGLVAEPVFATSAAIFATSSRLERGFWEMAYTIEQWPDLRG